MPKPTKTDLLNEAEQLARQYVEQARIRDAASTECDTMRARIRDIMEATDIESLDYPGVAKVTYVAPSSSIIDQEKLRKVVGEAMWRKITTRVLDKNKLDAFVKSKEIPAKAVVRCTNEVPGTTYAKVTPK